MSETHVLLASTGVLVGVSGYLGEALRHALLALSVLFVVLVLVSFIASRLLMRRPS